MDFIRSFFGFLTAQWHNLVSGLARLWTLLSSCLAEKNCITTTASLWWKRFWILSGYYWRWVVPKLEIIWKINDKYDNTRQRQVGSMCGIKIMDTGKCHSCSLQLCCVWIWSIISSPGSSSLCLIYINLSIIGTRMGYWILIWGACLSR